MRARMPCAANFPHGGFSAIVYAPGQNLSAEFFQKTRTFGFAERAIRQNIFRAPSASYFAQKRRQTTRSYNFMSDA
jgi:hypothetical protein